MDDTNLINHICKRLQEAEIENFPYSHKFVENIFPEHEYIKILENLPVKEFYKSKVELDKKAKEDNYSPERYEFLINMDNLQLLSKGGKGFWYNLCKSLFNTKIQNTVLEVFKGTISDRLNNLTESEKNKIGTKNYKITKRATIVKDFKKYHLGAHTDNAKKLITFLFYLPKDDSLDSLGTSIYECKPGIDPLKLDRHLSSDDTKKFLDKIKTFKFIPNSLLIFPRTNTSFHGVDEINIDSKDRDLLLFNYYIMGEK
jgi:hypothetical protein